jgi:hypothetical protein
MLPALSSAAPVTDAVLELMPSRLRLLVFYPPDGREAQRLRQYGITPPAGFEWADALGLLHPRQRGLPCSAPNPSSSGNTSLCCGTPSRRPGYSLQPGRGRSTKLLPWRPRAADGRR